MRIYYLIFIIYFITSCKISNYKSSELPSWVKDRPVSKENFIGIGYSDKTIDPINYKEKAKAEALSEIINQLDLSFTNQMIFLSLEKNDFINELINNSHDYLEGYVLENEFNTQNDYYVYYTLNKKKHVNIKNSRIKELIKKSTDHLYKNDFEDDLKNQYFNIINSISKLKLYLNEDLIAIYNREKVFLSSHILAIIKKYYSNFRIVSKNKKINTFLGNDIDSLRFQVLNNSSLAKNIPLKIEANFFDNKVLYTETDEKGICRVNIPNVKNITSTQKIIVSINFKKWIDEATNDSFIKKIILNNNSHKITLPINVYEPKVFLDLKFDKTNQEVEYDDLKFELNKVLKKYNCIIVNKKNADLTISVEKAKNFQIKIIDKNNDIIFYKKKINLIEIREIKKILEEFFNNF